MGAVMETPGTNPLAVSVETLKQKTVHKAFNDADTVFTPHG